MRCGKRKTNYKPFSNTQFEKTNIDHLKWSVIIKLFDLGIGARHTEREIDVGYPAALHSCDVMEFSTLEEHSKTYECSKGPDWVEGGRILEGIFLQIPFCHSPENLRRYVGLEPCLSDMPAHLYLVPTQTGLRWLYFCHHILDALFWQLWLDCVPLYAWHFMNHEECICAVIVRSSLSQITYKMIGFRMR